MTSTNNIKILFMGTPVFAAEILEELIKNKYQIAGVVSQPDKKVGRNKKLTTTPVKNVAVKYNIPVFQPIKVRVDYDFIQNIKPDLIITAAYGQIIPQAVLDIPPLGCINVHGSLLPKYRGGAPIHYAILNGDTSTGVTIMEMSAKMDAGNIISQQAFPISFDDNLKIVHDNMLEVAKKLLIDTLPCIIDKSYVSTVQKEDEVIFSPNISPQQERISWDNEGIDIYNLIRALNPVPSSYTTLNNKRFKITAATYIDKSDSTYVSAPAGTIVSIDKTGIQVSALNCNLLITMFQIEGKKKTTISDFINGNTSIKAEMVFI